MNFKLMLILLLAGIHASSAEEIEPSIMIKNAIMDADEVRIAYLVSSNDETLNGYRSVTPKGKKLLAEVFTKTDIRGLGNPDGTQDPTGGAGFNTASCMILNAYKNKHLTHEMIIIAGDYIHLIVPKDAWYEALFTSIPKDDSPLGIDESDIEEAILRDVKKLSPAGDWEEALVFAGDMEKVTAHLEKFMPGIVKPAAPKPAQGQRSPNRSK